MNNSKETGKKLNLIDDSNNLKYEPTEEDLEDEELDEETLQQLIDESLEGNDFQSFLIQDDEYNYKLINQPYMLTVTLKQNYCSIEQLTDYHERMYEMFLDFKKSGRVHLDSMSMEPHEEELTFYTNDEQIKNKYFFRENENYKQAVEK